MLFGGKGNKKIQFNTFQNPRVKLAPGVAEMSRLVIVKLAVHVTASEVLSASNRRFTDAMAMLTEATSMARAR